MLLWLQIRRIKYFEQKPQLTLLWSVYDARSSPNDLDNIF